MNIKKRIVAIVVLMCLLSCELTAVTLDTAVINSHKTALKAQQGKRKVLLDAGIVAGASVIGLYLAYVGYSKMYGDSPAHNGSDMYQFLQENRAVIFPAIELYKEQQQSWWNSTPAWLVKTAGSIILQSLVLTTLEPFYSHIRNYLVSEVVLPVKRFWFLSEQFNILDTSDRKVKVTQELAKFIMNIDAVEVTYKEHQALLLKEAAEYIISHILFVKEQVPAYQKVIAEKIAQKLDTLFQQMLDESQDEIYNTQHLEEFKDTMRTLRVINAYCIS